MSKENLHLPKTIFSMKADLAKKEPDILRQWEQNKTFQKFYLSPIFAKFQVLF